MRRSRPRFTPTARPPSGSATGSWRKASKRRSQSGPVLVPSPCWTRMARPCCWHWPAPTHSRGAPPGRCSYWPTSWSSVGWWAASPTRRCGARSKKQLAPWLRQRWCIPEVSPAFVAAMEDVLDLYAEPYDPAYPVAGFDERPLQPIADTRTPPARPTRSAAAVRLRVPSQLHRQRLHHRRAADGLAARRGHRTTHRARLRSADAPAGA